MKINFSRNRKFRRSEVEIVNNQTQYLPKPSKSYDFGRFNNQLININKPEMGTMAAKIENKSKLNDENVVKVITENKITNENFPIALDFKRRANDQIINIYHHIGIYAFKPEILKKIINLKQTKNEIKNRLEQLRAMENRIKINVALAKFSPIGIDTMEDYLALKKLLEYNS